MASSRRKSCDACVKDKRRCELGRPKCRRCITKGLECVYPESVLASSSVGVDNAQNRGGTTFADGWPQVHLPSSVSTSTPSPSMNGTWFEYCNEPFNLPCLPEDALLASNASAIDHLISQQSLTGLGQVDRSSDVQVRTEFVSQRFAFIPKAFVEQAQTTFIHRGLVQISPTPVLQDALSASALYHFRNDNNRVLAIRNLEHRARHLIETTNPQATPRSALLSATQALLIYQLIRLFDGDIRLRAQAEADELHLTTWASQLRSTMKPVAPSVSDSDEASDISSNTEEWQAWLVEESLRRTVITANMLKGIYYFLRTGWEMDVDVRLSFTAHASLWDAQSQQRWLQLRNENPGLEVRVTNWNDDIGRARPNDLEELGIQLMIMLWGKDATAQWLGSCHAARYGLDPRAQVSGSMAADDGATASITSRCIICHSARRVNPSSTI